MQYINEAAELWLQDLETTDAPQATGRLHTTNEGFCCLGRAFVVNGVKPDDNKTSIYKSYDGSLSSLSEKMIRLLGLRPELGIMVIIPIEIQPEHPKFTLTNLTELNDSAMNNNAILKRSR